LLNESGLYRSERDSIFWSLVSDSDELPLLFSAFSVYNNNNISIDYKNKFIYVGTSNGIYRTGIVTAIDENEPQLPVNNYSLAQNYPNPFNPSTIISYQVAEKSFVTLKVYDVLGNEIATLVNEEKPAGSYEVEFQSAIGSWQLTSGMYFYQLMVGNYVETKKMLLIK